jgi:HSP20 family protein
VAVSTRDSQLSRTQPTQVLRWDPQSELQELRVQLGRLLGAPVDLALPSGFTPAADIEETDDAYIVELDLPGVGKKDVDVSMSGQVLTIRGERKEKERVGILRRRVRKVGEFSFEVQFPQPVKEDDLTANLDDGVLVVRVPKADATASSRRVEVT